MKGDPIETCKNSEDPNSGLLMFLSAEVTRVSVHRFKIKGVPFTTEFLCQKVEDFTNSLPERALGGSVAEYSQGRD